LFAKKRENKRKKRKWGKSSKMKCENHKKKSQKIIREFFVVVPKLSTEPSWSPIWFMEQLPGKLKKSQRQCL